jgi:hypothetical protein
VNRLDRRIVAWSIATALLALGTIVAVWPEPPARALTANEGWTITGRPGQLTVRQFPPTLSYLRRSVLASGSSLVFRSWTPDRGLQQFEAISPPFTAASVMSVVVTGTTRTADGGHRAFFSCSAHPQQIDVFLGSVNVNGAEAIVPVPPRWCAGETRLHLVARAKDANVGVGAVFEISALSAWKSSFLGLLPYLALALLIPGAIALTGAALVARFVPMLPALPSALASGGIAALAAFLAYSFVPARVSGLLPLAALVALVAGLWAAGRDAVASTAKALAPSAAAWATAAVAFFALLCAADNGLAHWAPNYRFWPAEWSSDNELPWLFAEGIRKHADLAGLFGGGWRPTDRPPLMTGAHLLVADVFGWLQAGNDGTYLRGLAFDAAAVTFSALWVPAALFLVEAMLGLNRRRAFAVVLVVALLPFAIFNTVYGWPKAFGAAFGLAALVMAALAIGTERGPRMRAYVVAFGVLAALGALAHASGLLFLLPVAVWLAVATIKKDPRGLAIGASVGAALWLVWIVYQRAVLPSHGPLTKFALTGDFGSADPQKSLLTMLVERYSTFTIAQWLATKGRMLRQPILPVDTPIDQIHLNTGFGVDLLGSLRHWDLMLISGGNVLILVAAVVMIAARARVRGAPASAWREGIDIAAERCVWIAVAVWAVLALVFFRPLVFILWPHAAILALACAVFGWTSARRPTLFRAIAVAALLYAGLVWILGPLREARAIDVVALTVFALTAAWLVFGYLPGFDAEGRGDAPRAMPRHV